MKDLTIHCSDTPGEALEVNSIRLGMGRVSIQSVDLTNQAESGPVIHLDEAKARELFNWLGVWLHTVPA